MALVDALEALLVEHDRIGSPLREELVPGLPRSHVDAAIRDLGLIPPRSLTELHAWRDIRRVPPPIRVTWFWPAGPFRLDEAVALYRQDLEIGAITRDDLAEVLRQPQPPGATNTGYWRTDWFPVLGSSPETYAIECSLSDAEDAPVWRVNWHPDAGFETIQVAPSLEWLVNEVVELFRVGAYRWDSQYRAVVTLDSVFEERGLGEHCRPPVASHA